MQEMSAKEVANEVTMENCMGGFALPFPHFSHNLKCDTILTRDSLPL